MHIGITHVTRLEYDHEVVEGIFDNRLGPHSDMHQRWERHDLVVRPRASTRRYTDGFGNAANLITIPAPHNFVEVISRGEVGTLLVDPFALPPEPPAPLSAGESIDSLWPTALVGQQAELTTIVEDFRPATPADTFDAVYRLAKFVYDNFTYEQQVTTVPTTMAEVLASRTGVCQDFAHVLLGLCRAIGIPARYVSGYIVTDSRPTSSPRAPERGGGASHALAEAFLPTHGWRGFDPTNNLVAAEHHFKIATGRDYNDVRPTRGAFCGAGRETLTVEVTTRRLR